ncbi:MAG: radical SAM protein [Lachnospiraceae bacterium]
MKKSKYNIEITQKDKNLIFNTKTRNCIILDDSELKMYNEIGVEFEKELFDLGIYVDDVSDEYEEIENIINSNIARDKNTIKSHTIYTTTCCNAHCHYCFEEEFTRESMSLQVANKIIDYILKNQDDAKKLYLIWFGGEPLLNINVIDRISRELKRRLPSDVEFRSSIYTNGVLFSDELIERAIVDWNLKAVQITIDGLKTTYENIKRYNFENAFDVVIDRILSIIETGIRIQIRINYDDTNINEALELIEYLKNLLPTKKDVLVYANKIFRNDSDDNREDSIENDFLIFKKLVDCGFCKDILGSIKNNYNTCLAGSEYSTLFLPSGDIIKCDRDCKSVVGDVYGKKNQEEIKKWKDNRINPLCKTCKVFPLCGGGCIYEFLRGKKGCMTSYELIKMKLQYYLDTI